MHYKISENRSMGFGQRMRTVLAIQADDIFVVNKEERWRHAAEQFRNADWTSILLPGLCELPAMQV